MMITAKKMVGLMTASLVLGVVAAMIIASVWGIPGSDDASEGSNGSGSAEQGQESHEGHEHAEGGEGGEGGEEGDAETYYTCPMHPSVVSDSPGACPVCGMDLVEKKKGGDDMDPQELARLGKVALSPTQRVLANVQTTKVEANGTADTGEQRAVGVVTYDETGLATIPSWVDGRIEKLHVKQTGATVSRGQPVMDVYSRELLTAQEEFLIARDSAGNLAQQAKKRLELLGMNDSQINRLERTGESMRTVTMGAPNAGTITSINVRQGQYVTEGSPLYEIADLSNVWIDAEVHERNLRDIKEGMGVRVTSESLGGESLDAKVTFIHPVVQGDTRTVKVRVEVDNSEIDGTLKPGMYASVFFETSSDEAADGQLVVPRTAVIRGGKTNSVYVEVEENVFERREVEVGQERGDYLVITSGLEAGDEVAYRGGFLLDSEVQLNSFGGSAPHAGHDGNDGGSNSDEDHAEHPDLSKEDIPEEGKEFDPPVPSEAVPEGTWFCDMGTSHWIQHEEGDGECPVCGMHLKEKP
ncbi:MAG: efflux RND transporter periplasmic adaptor subunit [Persicimonas sp.]